MSINRFGKYTTLSLPVISPVSLFIVAHLACVTTQTSPHLNCVNLHTLTHHTCKPTLTPGCHGYGSTVSGQHAYIVTNDRKTIHKLNVSGDCLILANTRTGLLDFGDNLWISYDGTQLFLSTGLTLSSNDLSTMSVLGNKAVGVFNYTSVAQLFQQGQLFGKEKWPIMALRSTSHDMLYYFKWPDLSTNGTQSLPTPEGYNVVHPIRLQYCQMDFAYALVTYRKNNDSSLRTGVAYVKYYF